MRIQCAEELEVCVCGSPGATELFPGPAGGEGGGEEETGGGHSQGPAAGGRLDRRHPEGSAEGNPARWVGSGVRGAGSLLLLVGILLVLGWY